MQVNTYLEIHTLAALIDVFTDLDRRMCGHLITAGVHHSFTIRVIRSIAHFVILPTALLLVLYGVHVVNHHGAIGLAVAEHQVNIRIISSNITTVTLAFNFIKLISSDVSLPG